MSLARRGPRNEAGVSIKKDDRLSADWAGRGLAGALLFNGSVNGYVALKTNSEPANDGYLNTRRPAVVPFILQVSIRFAASPIQAREPIT